MHAEERRNSALLHTTLECHQKFYRRCLRRKSNRRVPRWEKSFQPPDEGLQNLLKVAKCHGFKPRSTTGRKKYESKISNATTRKIAGVKSIYISNNPTSAKVEERKEEHIKTGQLGNIITTSYYRVFEVVQSTSQI
jgi:hypothetical protein